MKSLTTIFSIMTESNTPFWVLQIMDGRNRVPAGSFMMKSEDDGERRKGDKHPDMDKSQRMLETLVKTHDDDGDTLFEITLSQSANSHGSGRIGPFQFTQDGNDKRKGTRNDPAPPNQGMFAGLGMMPPSLSELMQLDRSHGNVQFQMQMLELDKQRFQQEKESFMQWRADERAAMKERAEEAKQSAIAEGNRQVDWERKKLEQERLNFEATKQQWETLRESQDGINGKLKDVLGVVVDLAHAKIMGQPANALSGTADDDPHWALCEQIANELHQFGQPGFTQAVHDYMKKLWEHGKTGS